MHPNSLWVSLDFEWIWTFYHGETGQPPKWIGTNCYEQWIGPLVPTETILLSSEIQIY